MANTRRHRLELPAAPKTDDPTAIQKYLADIRRLTMDEFNRLAGDYYDFREEVIASATIPLASVASISVTTTPYTATFTWENPVQPQGLPSHVRFRIAEFGDTWAEYTYPQLSWTAYGLNPNTQYTFQMQLVRRSESTISFVSALRNCPSIPVQVESLSEIRSRSFTTDPGLGPPTNPGDGTSVFPIPDTDNPGPVGGPGCWWEWQIQIANQTTGEWEDTIYAGSAAGNIGNIVFDISILDPDREYRFKYREVCNGTPGPWLYGEPFTGGPDWLNACGGNDPSSSYLGEPFASADLFAIPYGCSTEGEGWEVRDYVSGAPMVQGNGFSHLFRTTAGEWVMKAETWTDAFTTKLMGSFSLPLIQTLDNASDFSINFELQMISLPNDPPGGFGTGPVLSIGGRIVFSVTYSENDEWGVTVTIPREVGGNMVLTSPIENPAGFFDGVPIRFISDADGNKILIVDGSIVASDGSGQELRLDGMTDALQISGYSQVNVSKVYGWARALPFQDTALIGGLGIDNSEGEEIADGLIVADVGTLVLLVAAIESTSSSVGPVPSTIMTGTTLVAPNPTQVPGGGFTSYVRYVAKWGFTDNNPWDMNNNDGVGGAEICLAIAVPSRTQVLQTNYGGDQSDPYEQIGLLGAKTPESLVYCFLMRGRTTSTTLANFTDLITSPPAGWEFVVRAGNDLGVLSAGSMLVFKSTTESLFPFTPADDVARYSIILFELGY